MSPVDNLRAQVLSLDEADRALLARDLIASLEPEPAEEENSSAWSDEILARSATVAKREYTASHWKESVERIRRHMKKRPV